jgi:hypothetical protein
MFILLTLLSADNYHKCEPICAPKQDSWVSFFHIIGKENFTTDMLKRNDNRHNLFFYKKERNKEILGSTFWPSIGSQRF